MHHVFIYENSLVDYCLLAPKAKCGHQICLGWLTCQVDRKTVKSIICQTIPLRHLDTASTSKQNWLQFSTLILCEYRFIPVVQKHPGHCSDIEAQVQSTWRAKETTLALNAYAYTLTAQQGQATVKQWHLSVLYPSTAMATLDSSTATKTRTNGHGWVLYSNILTLNSNDPKIIWCWISLSRGTTRLNPGTYNSPKSKGKTVYNLFIVIAIFFFAITLLHAKKNPQQLSEVSPDLWCFSSQGALSASKQALSDASRSNRLSWPISA